MGTRQRSARVDWVAADFPSKDAAKRTARHFVFQRCERETRQHIKAELPGSCSQSKFNRGSSTLTHPAAILYICLSNWLSCRRFTQKKPIKKTQKNKTRDDLPACVCVLCGYRKGLSSRRLPWPLRQHPSTRWPTCRRLEAADPSSIRVVAVACSGRDASG